MNALDSSLQTNVLLDSDASSFIGPPPPDAPEPAVELEDEAAPPAPDDELDEGMTGLGCVVPLSPEPDELHVNASAHAHWTIHAAGRDATRANVNAICDRD